jgi:hypothetical protein
LSSDKEGEFFCDGSILFMVFDRSKKRSLTMYHGK